MHLSGRWLNAVDIQTWILIFYFIENLGPRFCVMKHLRCVCKAARVTVMEIPSWKLLGINSICNYPYYPHVHKWLHGLVHPLVGLEPTYAPGRPNRRILCESNMPWNQHSQPLYSVMDIETVNLDRSRWGAESAPPAYRPRDE